MYQINYLDIKQNNNYDEVIKKVVEECFKKEGLINSNLFINITLTTPGHIKILNAKYRGIDQETDVLSFPMFEKNEIDKKIEKQDFKYKDILGDMVISIPKVEEQAIEYGHSFERELAYMVVHSFYHLMGYDHIKEEDKAIMRSKEEIILNNLNITR